MRECVGVRIRARVSACVSNYTVKTENGYQAALRPRLPPRAAPRLVHQDLWPIRTNVGGFFFGFEVGIPDL